MSDSRSVILRWPRFAVPAKKIAKLRLSRALVLAFSLIAVHLSAPLGEAQTAVLPSDTVGAPPSPRDSVHYWQRFAAGFAISLLAHESAHVLTSLAVGAHPYIALDKGRPTVFSGINSDEDPHDQFLFSAAGLTTQALINELILDIPHSRGGSIERGILAGGIATTLFYITLGRNASVSDISVMARTSSFQNAALPDLRRRLCDPDPTYFEGFAVRPLLHQITTERARSGCLFLISRTAGCLFLISRAAGCLFLISRAADS